MERAMQIGENATVYLGNGFELLASMADASVDHVITDPPYAEQTHRGARSQKGDPGRAGAAFIEFEHFTDEQFIQLCAEAVRVARRWVILTCDWKHAALLSKADLPLIRLGVWTKPNAAPQFTGDRPGMGFEMVAIFHRPGKLRWNGGGKHAVWDYPVTQRAEVATQKPLKLLQRWVADFTDPGDLIIDPMMGSATTGIAALSLDRFFIGCEVNPDHFDKAAARIRTFAQQMRLPIEVI